MNRMATLTGRRPVLPTLTAAIVAILLAACNGATPTSTPPSTTALQQRMEETVVLVSPPPSASSEGPGPTISELSVTDEQISWRTSAGGDKSLELAKVEGAYPDIFDPGLSKFSKRKGPVSPSGRFFAFVVAPVVGGLLLNGWHLGLADADGALVGLYSAQTHPMCYVHDFVWLPDEKGIVVEPAACGGVGHLVLLTEDAKVVFDVTTRGIKGILSISPDSRWVALDDGPGDRLHPRINRRIEFISLEDPNIRLDLPADELNQWLGLEWARPVHIVDTAIGP